MKYGSTVNGLCNKTSSDLDLTILIPDFSVNHKHCLRQIEKQLDKTRYEVIRLGLDSSGFILALKDKQEQFEVDITVNKLSEVYNSLLLQKYAIFDKRFEKIVHTLKKWG